ncbi:hypothetical protein EK21DRAFT_109199 [Setomelanomma holmii]|uniref:Uncharacterized protein n=1 Tax=Setomelanomma holmii TaxID=210430 RepID=A0A9P4HGC0_9PLEO|nr:hypothetical protein EK21DRAFT_109199 [Setomelanomma holmii]
MALSYPGCDIPQVCSSPEDPDRRSFLSLLPEVRNRIYDLLLKKPDDVTLIHRFAKEPDEQCKDKAQDRRLADKTCWTFDALGARSLALDLANYQLSDFRWLYASDNPPGYVVSLSTQAAIILANIRISTSGFFRQMLSTPNATRVSFERVDVNTRHPMEDPSRTKLSAMIERCFLFLTDIYYHSPARAKTDSIVKVYINGYGCPTHATIQESSKLPIVTIHNSRMALGEPRIRNMTGGRAKKLSMDRICKLCRKDWTDDDRDREFADFLGHIYDKYKET